MGLLSKLSDKFSSDMKTEDHHLLLHALMMMAGADTVLEDAELGLLESFWMTLPEFRGMDYAEEMEQARKMASQFESQQEAIQALDDIDSEAARTKCFVLCADMAMASGDISKMEDELLESMQRVLGIDDETATKILEVLALKYAS